MIISLITALLFLETFDLARVVLLVDWFFE